MVREYRPPEDYLEELHRLQQKYPKVSFQRKRKWPKKVCVAVVLYKYKKGRFKAKTLIPGETPYIDLFELDAMLQRLLGVMRGILAC